jgi:hypothetical protein
MQEINMRLVLDSDGFRGELRDAQGNVLQFGQAADQAGTTAAKGLKRTEDQARQTTGAINTVRGAIAEFGRGVAQGIGQEVARAIRQLPQLATQSINLADQLSKMSQKVGVSIESLSTLGYAADRSGVGLEPLQGAMVRLAVNASEAARGTGESRAAFDQLGISVTDNNGRLKSADTLLREVAQGISQLGGGVEKTDLAVKLFGRTGAELIPLLDQGAEGIAALEERARSLGLELDANTGRSAEQFNDLLADLGSLGTGVGNELARQLLPSMTQLVSQFVDASREGDGLKSVATAIADVLRVLAAAAFVAKAGIEAVVNIVAASIDVMDAGARSAYAFAQNYTLWGLVLPKSAEDSKNLGQILDELKNRTDAATSAAGGGLSMALSGLTDKFEALFNPSQAAAEGITNTASSAEHASIALTNLQAGLSQQAAQLEQQVATFGKGRAGALEYAQGLEIAKAATMADTAEREKYVAGVKAAFEPLLANARALDAMQAAQKRTQETQRAAQRDQRELSREVERATTAQLKFKDELLQMEAALAGPVRAAQIDYERRLEDLDRRLEAGEIELLDYYRALELVEQGYNRTSQAAQEQEDVIGRLSREYAEQARLAGLSTDQRRIEISVAQALAAEEQNLTKLTEEQREAKIALIRATVEAGEQSVIAAELSRDAANTGAQAWQDFADGLVDAFAKGSDGVKAYFKRLLQDLLRQWASSALLRAMGSFFGGNAGLTTANAQGGGLSQLAAMFMGGGGGGSGGGGGMNWISTIASLFGGGGGSSGAGGIAGMFGGASTGTATGFWSSIGSYFGIGSGAASGTGAAASGASSAATSSMAIPIIGWIIAGMLANEAAFAGGWRGNSTTGPGPELNSAMAMPGGPQTGDQILQAMGFNERWASLISGSALHTRLWGRRQPVVTGADSEYAFGPEGVSGSSTLDVYRRGGYFRSSRRYQETTELPEEGLETARGIFDDLSSVIAESARRLRAEAPAMLAASLRVVQEMDNKGRHEATRFFVDLLGRSWEAADDGEAVARLQAEAILHTIDSVMGNVVPAVAAASGDAIAAGVQQGAAGAGAEAFGEYAEMLMKSTAAAASQAMQGEASAIAERWRSDTAALAQGAEFLLAVTSDIRSGFDLLGTGTLTPIINLLDDVAIRGETMADTYARVVGSTQLLEQALGLSGVTLDKTREEFVRFAVGIADAAGGLERAAALWQGYRDSFFSVMEQLELALAQSREGTGREFSDIGLDVADFQGDEGRRRFRELFESALPTLSEEAIVQWLEAGNALGALLGLEAQRTAILAEQQAALLAYQAEVQELRDELESTGMSTFAREMQAISRWTSDATDSLNAAARAAGMQAAAEEDLALVHQVAAQRAAAAIARLREAAADLVTQLYGSPLDQINAQIAAIEAAQQTSTSNQVGAIEQVGAAARGVYEAQLSALQNIRQWLDSQLLGDLSSLTPEQRLTEARRQFDEAAAAAAGGDVEALQRMTQLADALLREERSFSASGPQWGETEAYVRQRMAELAGMQLAQPPLGGPGSSAGGGGSVTSAVVSPELQALYEQRDALLNAQLEQQRAAMLRELGSLVRELIQATGEPLSEVAQTIGLNLTALAGDLGIQLDELSAETALSLTALARQLGVDVAELAANVGVELGALGDRQSLLNQALDQTLEGVPADLREQLSGPLEAIRNATSEADATAAVEAAENAIRAMPAGVRDLLAPFFEGIGPAPIISELTTLRDINSTAAAQLSELSSIRQAIEAIGRNLPDVESGLASFDVGTAYVPRTGPALIHQGETILPAAVADFARRSGLTIGAPSVGDSAAVVAELRALRQDSAASQRTLAQLIESMERAQRDTADLLAAEQRRAYDRIGMRA